MAIIHTLQSTALTIPGSDIDTDRIIPARFLRCITFNDLAAGLFYDERFDQNNKALNHPLNSDQAKHSKFLVTGDNFGCGSSREHAPQAILRSGYQAIIGTSFAEIFFGNACNIGLVCVTVSKEIRQNIVNYVSDNPNEKLTINIADLTIQYGNQIIPCYLPKGIQEAFLAGTWDNLFTLLKSKALAQAVADKLPYV